jgi:hypothetical protein
VQKCLDKQTSANLSAGRQVANPGFGSGLTNTAEHFILTSNLYFSKGCCAQSAAAVGGRIANATPAQSPGR